MKAAHRFNVLDARGAISVTERQRFIGRVRAIAKAVAEAYLAQREALGFPLLPRTAAWRDGIVEGSEAVNEMALEAF